LRSGLGELDLAEDGLELGLVHDAVGRVRR
jgi:hypothetical protein